MELIFSGDKYKMNWLREDFPYAKVICPPELTATVENRREGDVLTTEIRLTNTGRKPYFTSAESISISLPLQDRYDSSEVCMKYRCHAHLFCGLNVTYVMALRMGGEAPHLGLALTEGSIASYSVERSLLAQSNDRGCFWLHPEAMEFAPGETRMLRWVIFPHQGREDFYQKLAALPRYVQVEAERYVVFAGEKISLRIAPSFAAREVRVNGERLEEEAGAAKRFPVFIYEEDAAAVGERRFEIDADGVRTVCRIFVQAGTEALTERRCRFIAERQQYRGTIAALQGALLAYDNEEQTLVYRPENDFNGGRERFGMGLLLARYLRNVKVQEKKPAVSDAGERETRSVPESASETQETRSTSESAAEKQETRSTSKSAAETQEPETARLAADCLRRYEAYVLRELVDAESGLVCNDMGRDDSYKRLYNAPWAALFFCELYGLYRERRYLEIVCRIVRRFYADGGRAFYPIELPVVELVRGLREAGMAGEEKEMIALFAAHADRIAEVGTNYPAHEVNYEQSIVAPAADVLLAVYDITGERRYLEAAEKQLAVLGLFHGSQPDWHLHGTAIRHWDGYWFGKRRLYGDTFPHYWSALSGKLFCRYGRLTGNKAFLRRGEETMRGVLPMIFADGSASCAYVYPQSVNGVRAGFFDPYANDQDWGLYLWLRERNVW